MLRLPEFDAIVALALAEDLGVSPSVLLASAPPDPGLLERDVTSASVLPEHALFSGAIRAREAGVVCGLPVVAGVYEMLTRAAGLSEAVEVFPLVAEGAVVEPGRAVAEVEGPAVAVLAGERTALEFLGVMSGIATRAREWQTIAGERLRVLDTRKTLPGMRALSKYAVRVGGGTNHREGLWDMILIKDNHIARAGGIRNAVAAASAAHPDLAVQVEADTEGQALEAVAAGADAVLLDNMDDATLASAVAAVRVAAEKRGRPCLTEASGGVTRERLSALAATGVDRVSAGALTLAAPLDFGLDEVTDPPDSREDE